MLEKSPTSDSCYNETFYSYDGGVGHFAHTLTISLGSSYLPKTQILNNLSTKASNRAFGTNSWYFGLEKYYGFKINP